MSSPIRKPTPQRSNGRSFDELAGTNRGNSSRSTRNRLPVQRQASEAAERIIPVRVDLLHHGSKKKTPNTSTAQWFMTKTKTKRRGGGKRKKGKTQKKRSNKKRSARKH